MINGKIETGDIVEFHKKGISYIDKPIYVVISVLNEKTIKMRPIDDMTISKNDVQLPYHFARNYIRRISKA